MFNLFVEGVVREVNVKILERGVTLKNVGSWEA